MVEAFFNDFAENSYILHDSVEAYLIDPGSNTSALRETVDERGLTVKGILLTHGHYDHVNGVNSLLETYDVPVYIHESDRDFLFDPGLNLSIHMGGASQRFKLESKDKLVTFTEKDTFQLGSETITVSHTPGHTRGCVLFHYKDIIFTGDTLFRETVGRTDLPTIHLVEKLRCSGERVQGPEMQQDEDLLLITARLRMLRRDHRHHLFSQVVLERTFFPPGSIS